MPDHGEQSGQHGGDARGFARGGSDGVGGRYWFLEERSGRGDVVDYSESGGAAIVYFTARMRGPALDADGERAWQQRAFACTQ